MKTPGSVDTIGFNGVNNDLRTRSRTLAEQVGANALAEQAGRVGQNQPGSPVNDLAARGLDVAQISDEAVKRVSTQDSKGEDQVRALTEALKNLYGEKLEKDPNPEAEAANAQEQQQQQQKPKQSFTVEFQPAISEGTIQAPGDAIGEFKVKKDDQAPQANPVNQNQQAQNQPDPSQNKNGNGTQAPGAVGGAGGSGGRGGGAGGAGGAGGGAAAAGGAGAASAANGSRPAAQRAPGLNQGQTVNGNANAGQTQGLNQNKNGNSGVSNPDGSSSDADQVTLSPEAGAAMQKMQAQNPGNMPGGGPGMVKDSAGGSAPIPPDGGTLKTKNWEQCIWINPGGDLKKTGGLIEVFRKLDNAPSEIYFDQKDKKVGEIADGFDKKSKAEPGSQGQMLADEAARLRNPSPTKD